MPLPQAYKQISKDSFGSKRANRNQRISWGDDWFFKVYEYELTNFNLFLYNKSNSSRYFMYNKHFEQDNL